MSKISLVIPGYNVESCLERCLRSASELLESRRIIEIIFVDNNSTDRSREVAKIYNVKLLECSKKGASAARNIGWRNALGDYVWFVDADCRVEGKTIDILIETILKQDVEAVSGGYLNDSSSSLLAELIQGEFDYRYSKMQGLVSYATTCNLLCKKELLVELNGFSEDISSVEDGDFVFRMLSLSKKIIFNSDSRLFHLHPENWIVYLKKQAFHAFWAVRLYSRHPSRIFGHSYSNLIDHLQPFLVLLFIASAPYIGRYSLVFLSIFLMAQIPIMRFLYANRSLFEALSFTLFSLVRTIARLIGICLGSLSALLNVLFRFSLSRVSLCFLVF